jgi:hypothetical protein
MDLQSRTRGVNDDKVELRHNSVSKEVTKEESECIDI